MTAREKFKIGDLVRLNDSCVARLSWRDPNLPARRSGKVTGYGRDPSYVRVTRDGCAKEDRLGWRIDDLEIEPRGVLAGLEPWVRVEVASPEPAP